MKLSEPEKAVLRALMQGSALKVHRSLDGEKVYRLHPLAGQPEPVAWRTVNQLKRRRLIDSNKKFPAATYLLTDRGRRVAETLTDSDTRPLTARNF